MIRAWFRIIITRIWRRHRRHYLSVDELSMRNDLSITEITVIMQIQKGLTKK